MKLIIKYLELRLKWVMVLHKMKYPKLTDLYTDSEFLFRYKRIYPLLDFIKLLKRYYKIKSLEE